MRPLHWKVGLAAGLLVLASGGLVVAQQPAPQTPPVVEAPPQEPPPAGVPTPPAKGPDTNANPDAGPPQETAPPEADEGKASKGKPKDVSEESIKPADSTTAPVPETPGIRARHSGAIIQALDKITAETMRFEVPIGRPVRYKGLVFIVRSCETSAPEEVLQDSMAYVQVRAEPKVQSGEETARQIFSGWMFASSPGLNALQHPIYDAWLIACKA
jgi:hypothetical protein